MILAAGMHITSASIVTAVAITSFLLTAAGIVGMGFRVGGNTQALKNYRDTAQSWKEKADLQEEEIQQCQERLAEKDAQIAELTAKVSYLEKLVLGETTGKALRNDHRRIETDLQDIRASVNAILEKVSV